MLREMAVINLGIVIAFLQSCSESPQIETESSKDDDRLEVDEEEDQEEQKVEEKAQEVTD